LKETIASDRVEWQGYYRLAATHFLCSQFLAPVWTAIQKDNPQLTAEVFTLRSAQVVSGVAAGELDFGLCFNPQAHPLIEAERIYAGRLVLVVRKDHPVLKVHGAQRIKRLNMYFTALPKAFQGIDSCESHPVFKKFGLTPKIRFIYDSDEVAARHIAGSFSWGLFPDVTFRRYRDKLVSIVPAGWDAELVVAALRPKNRFPTRVLAGLTGRLKGLLNG